MAKRLDQRGRMSLAGRQLTTMHPTGQWTEPCWVVCQCGFELKAPDCASAQRVAWAHTAKHDREAREKPS